MSRVRQVTLDAADALDLVHADPAPVAYIDELGDDGVNLKMRFYHDDGDRTTARDAVAEAIMAALSDAQIEMPTPELSIEHSHSDPDKPAG